MVWRFCDGRAGHENQSAGLIDALWRLLPLQYHDIRLGRWTRTATLHRRLPPPALVLGAGRRTHAPLLRAAAASGARSVVLMRPSRQWQRFDLCLVPAHDAPPRLANVLVTEGVLNRVRPHGERRHDGALVLIGGPSRHHDWLDRELATQVQALVAAAPQRHWTICDSRRTPLRTLALLADLLQGQSCRFVHWRDVASDWLARELGSASLVWVSEDSVSMVYEALTGGAAVGLLAVPRRGRGRVSSGVAELVRRGEVTPFGLWQAGRQPTPRAQRLAEAERCAAWIGRRWLSVG